MCSLSSLTNFFSDKKSNFKNYVVIMFDLIVTLKFSACTQVIGSLCNFYHQLRHWLSRHRNLNTSNTKKKNLLSVLSIHKSIIFQLKNTKRIIYIPTAKCIHFIDDIFLISAQQRYLIQHFNHTL
jgi:hypothetical protein